MIANTYTTTQTVEIKFPDGIKLPQNGMNLEEVEFETIKSLNHNRVDKSSLVLNF